MWVSLMLLGAAIVLLVLVLAMEFPRCAMCHRPCLEPLCKRCDVLLWGEAPYWYEVWE